MAPSDRFQPGDRIEYICHDQDPAAPAGGWVPGIFQRYLPWPEGHVGGPDDMKAIVIPQGCGEESALEVPIDELRFPPAPGPVTEPPPPGSRYAMPTVVNGMLVMSAFRILPGDGTGIFSWRVILRDHEAQWDTPVTYTVTRVHWTATAPGVADYEWRDIDVDANEGFRGLTWTLAALTFTRMLRIDAAPQDQD